MNKKQSATDFDPSMFATDEPALASKLNPFDPERLRLPQNFADAVGVTKLVTTVPCRKPDRQWFFRVRPGEEWRLPTAVIELREEREVYLVDPALAQQLPGEVKRVVVYTCINRQGVTFLWAVKFPEDSGRRRDGWSTSAHEAAARAQRHWVRLVANMSLGAYELYQATADDIPEPEWPDKTFPELLEVCFKDRFIQDASHDVIRQLLGAV